MPLTVNVGSTTCPGYFSSLIEFAIRQSGTQSVVGPVLVAQAVYNHFAVGGSTLYGLNNGNNAVTLQASTGSALILPPPSNATAVTLKGANGDTGIPLSKVGWSLLSLPTPVTNFVLNAGGSIADFQVVMV